MYISLWRRLASILYDSILVCALLILMSAPFYNLNIEDNYNKSISEYSGKPWILSPRPDLIIFDEPTRGIDVGAKAEIYKLMRELARNGVAIWMISSDMEEVLGISDRIVVMHEGRITGELQRDEFGEEAIMHLAVGHSKTEAN